MKIPKIAKMRKKMNLMSPTLLIFMCPIIPPSSNQFLKGVRCSFDTESLKVIFTLQMNHENFEKDYVHKTEAMGRGQKRGVELRLLRAGFC